MKKIIFPIVTLIVLITALSIGVNALAISMQYMPDKTLVVYPGESLDFELGLQNPNGEQDDLIEVTVIGGSEIARIVDEENTYKIPKGADDAKVHVKIDIPSDAQLGTEWPVQFRASLLSEKEGGMVQFKMSVADGFTVRVGPKPEPVTSLAVKEKNPLSAWSVGGIILVLLAALALVYYRKKKK